MNNFDVSLLHLEAINRVREIVMDFQRQYYMLDELEQEELEGEEKEEVANVRERLHQESQAPVAAEEVYSQEG